MKNKLLLIGSMLAFLPFGQSCNSLRVSIDKSYLNLAIGQTGQLTASVSDSAKKVTWTSENPEIVAVDQSRGTLLPLSAGRTKVTATVEGVSASCEVAVRMKTIIIGIDGGGEYIELGHTHCENITKIFSDNNHSATTVSHGCLTSNPTISAQCWGSMLCGVAPEIHKFENDTIAKDRNTTHPSIFYEARRQISDAKLASIVNWNPINYGIVEDDIYVDKFNYSDDDKKVTNLITKYLDIYEPDLLYVQFDSVDHAGHTKTYGSDEYYQALGLVDGYVGDIYKKLEDRKLLDKYNFIVTADHGGIGTTHGGLDDKEKYIFFGITGNNIKDNSATEKCRVIKDMNVIDITAILAHCLAIDNNAEWGKGITGGIKVPDNIFIN